MTASTFSTQLRQWMWCLLSPHLYSVRRLQEFIFRM